MKAAAGLVLALAVNIVLPASRATASPRPAPNTVQELDVQDAQGGTVVALHTTTPVPRFTCSLPPGPDRQVIIDFPEVTSKLRRRYVLDNALVKEAQVQKRPEAGLALRVRLLLEEAALVSVEQGTQGLNLRFQKIAPTSAVASGPAANGAPVVPAAASAAAPSAEYHVGPGDKLEINVYGHSDLDKVLEVRSDGNINYPLLGDVNVGGKTPAEIDDQMTQALSKDYLIDPKVSVDVREYGSQWVTVIGEVKNPGRYVLKGNMHLIDVLATAGGLTTYANRRSVQLLRGDNGVRHKSIVNLKSIEDGETQDLALMPSDVVIVPRRAF